MDVAVQAAEHVFISGQREASPGIKFRSTGASGPVRRPNICEENLRMGHVAESINTLFEIYIILRFQRSPHGAQCRSLWGGRGLLVVSV